MFSNLPLSKVYQLLEPGPVVLLTTAHKGRANVMTMSWHMMVEFSRRWSPVSSAARTISFSALRATRECVWDRDQGPLTLVADWRGRPANSELHFRPRNGWSPWPAN